MDRHVIRLEIRDKDGRVVASACEAVEGFTESLVAFGAVLELLKQYSVKETDDE